MNTQFKWQGLLPVAAISASVFCVTCSDPVTDPEPQDTADTTRNVVTEPHDVDKFLNALVFKNSSKVSGALPMPANTMAIKTNFKDTLYLLEGVKIPIRLSHPQTQLISGVFIGALNGSFYYDVPLEYEEETDTVSVIFIDIDPEDLDLPTAAPVKIIPHDETDQPIDIIERIVTLEEPSGPGCDITVPRPSTLGDTTGYWSPEWFWHHTVVYNSNGEITFVNAPGYAHITETTYEGCCDYNSNKNCNILSTDLNTEISVRIAYTIMNETFSFFTDGTFVRQTHEQKQNFDPETTEWCPGIAGYTREDVVVTYQGTHDYFPGAASISYGTTYSNCDLCGYGSRGGSLIFTCNMLVISTGFEGAREKRVYVRNPTSEWYE